MCVLAESDNESIPTSSPIKQNLRVRVKTLEEIRLEKIQAESAAYYSYPTEKTTETTDTSDDLRSRIIKRLNTKPTPSTDFEILSLDQIRKRKIKNDNVSTLNEVDIVPNKQIKTCVNSNQSDFKIMSLAEIRAAKMKLKDENIEEQLTKSDTQVRKKHSPIVFNETKELTSTDLSLTNEIKQSNLITEVPNHEVSSSRPLKRAHSPDDINTNKKLCDSTDSGVVSSTVAETSPKKIKLTHSDNYGFEDETNGDNSEKTDNSCGNEKLNISLTNKNVERTEESLLLDDDSNDSSVSLTGADDILQNIDDILND